MHRTLFLPGAGADPNFWRPLGERLPAGDKVYLGWPGLGAQPPHPSVASRADLLRLVEGAMGEGTCDLLAQSMGGVLALQAALKHPARVRRLVLSVTSGGVDVSALGAINWRDSYRRENPNAPAWVYESWGDVTEQLAELHAPTLLIWGDADPISPVAVGERLASLLPMQR
ncbi:MAG TPA: alpha/beta hydrolase [Caulobacteraceae bacterium]|jgi:pimeloyl-ACP methyl ester carboxylesterase